MLLRKSSLACLSLLLLLLGCAGPAQAPTVTPAPTDPPEWDLPGWELVWQDEFDGDQLDPASWIYDLGAGGWGNHELQYYTDRPENVRVEDGVLVIEARQEEYITSDYTSARIKTQELHAWEYGRIEASIKLPTGKGIWSAFWMLGEDFPIVIWPDSGEIDIMENIGDPFRVFGSVHGPGYSAGQAVGAMYPSLDTPLNEDFHTYAVEWRPGEIAWFVDDERYFQLTPGGVPGDWVYDYPFFIILCLAVGGDWPGSPDETTVFPQQMLVDYVRVYRDPNLDLSSLQQGAVHVADIRLDLEQVDQAWQGTATVSVVDQDGAPVPGVTVDAAWLGAVAGAEITGITGQDGRAGPFVARKTTGSKDLTFCVSNLRHPLLDYDKSANAMNCVVVDPEAAP